MLAEAALIAVPLPFSTPVMVVDRVIAGVVVAVATVPAKPLADTTLTLVTVPEPPPALSVKSRRVTGSKAAFIIVALSDEEVPPITRYSLSSLASLPFCVIAI